MKAVVFLSAIPLARTRVLGGVHVKRGTPVAFKAVFVDENLVKRDTPQTLDRIAPDAIDDADRLHRSLATTRARPRRSCETPPRPLRRPSPYYDCRASIASTATQSVSTRS